MARNAKSMKRNNEACKGILIAPSKLPRFPLGLRFSLSASSSTICNKCRLRAQDSRHGWQADIHDKSVSRGQKLSRRASEKRVHKILRCFSSRSCLSAVVPLRFENQTSICCLSPEGPAQKIEFVISCQSRNNSMGASGAYAPSPSRLKTRPGRLRAEEILLIFSPPCYAAVRFSLSTVRNSFWRLSTATK